MHLSSADAYRQSKTILFQFITRGDALIGLAMWHRIHHNTGIQSMKTLSITAACLALLFAGTAFAAPYGAAGCGLGSMLIGSEPGFMQIFAATTNGTSASQTFGISSGTSNCGAAMKGMPSAKAYIETNREALAKDMARGSGETLTHLSAIAGCKNNLKVAAKLQKQFKTVFPTANVSNKHVTQSVISMLKGDKALMCKSI